MIADTAEAGGGQRLFADARVAVRCDDQIAPACDFGSDHEFRIGLHNHLNTGCARGRGKPVFSVYNDHPDDVDAVLTQHLQGRHAEMARADKGNPHSLSSVCRPKNVDNMPCGRAIRPKTARAGLSTDRMKREPGYLSEGAALANHTSLARGEFRDFLGETVE